MMLRRICQRVCRFLSHALRRALWPLALVYCAVEYSVLLLSHVRALRHAEYVHPLWFWSFGHQAMDLHMLAMRFQGKRLLVLLSDYQNYNRYIVGSFQGVVSSVTLRHSPLARWCWQGIIGIRPTVRLKKRLLHLFLHFLRSKTEVVESFHERMGSLLEGIHLTEYIELLQSGRHPNIIQPLPSGIGRFRRILRATSGSAPGDWWVSFYFRQKGNSGSAIRDTDPQTYRPAIEYILKLGGRVFCGGDYDPHQIFSDMPSLVGYQDFPCDRTLIDFFFLTQCRFLVGGHSGPLAIATVFDVPVLITNCPCFCLSGYRPNQRIIYKHLKEQETGRVVPVHRTFSFPVITFTQPKEFMDAGLVLCDNSPEEILSGVKEMIELVLHKRDGAKTETQALEERFRSLLPKKSVAYQTPCHPTIHYLRHLQFE